MYKLGTTTRAFIWRIVERQRRPLKAARVARVGAAAEGGFWGVFVAERRVSLWSPFVQQGVFVSAHIRHSALRARE